MSKRLREAHHLPVTIDKKMPKNKKPVPFTPCLPPVSEEGDIAGHDRRVMRKQFRRLKSAFEQQIYDEHQRDGMEIYGLTSNEVCVKNFGEHTLEAMEILRGRDPELTDRAAYLQVERLDRHQAAGVVNYGLRRDQVEVPHFGVRTMKAMHVLINKQPTLKENILYALFGLMTWRSRQEVRLMAAYEAVQGLDAAQLKGVVSGLSRDEVLASSAAQDAVSPARAPDRHNKPARIIPQKNSPNIGEVGKFSDLHRSRKEDDFCEKPSHGRY